MHDGYSTLSVCLFVGLFVCYQSPARLYDKLDIPACSSLVFLGFQLTDFDKTVSFGFFGAFHGYFVVSSPYERFHILLVAILARMRITISANSASSIDRRS